MINLLVLLKTMDIKTSIIRALTLICTTNIATVILSKIMLLVTVILRDKTIRVTLILYSNLNKESTKFRNKINIIYEHYYYFMQYI